LPDGTVAAVIPVVENKTAFSGLAAPLTSALRRKTAEAGVPMESGGARVANLKVTIVSVNGEAGMLKVQGDELVPRDKIWRIDVEAEMTDRAGNILVTQERFSASGRAFVEVEPSSEEALGAERRAALMDDIADAVVNYMFGR
jgi:hypothetical protein